MGASASLCRRRASSWPGGTSDGSPITRTSPATKPSRISADQALGGLAALGGEPPSSSWPPARPGAAALGGLGGWERPPRALPSGKDGGGERDDVADLFFPSSSPRGRVWVR